jgi:hypothetical protein
MGVAIYFLNGLLDTRDYDCCARVSTPYMFEQTFLGLSIVAFSSDWRASPA